MTTPARTPATTAAVQVSDLTIAYGRDPRSRVVLDGIDLEVFAGSTVALVGESGSGKSTVANALLGHLRPGSRRLRGDVVVDDDHVFDLSASRLREFRASRVALVPQNAGHTLTPSMRVGTQLTELPVLRDRREEERARILAEAFENVGLGSEFSRRYPHQLSGGQQQRVAIAMALVVEPRVLILDEPTTGLDVVTQRGILGLLRRLAHDLQTATVVVSHDLGVVAALADDVAVLQNGRMLEHQPVGAVFESPRSEHTRELLAAVPRLPTVGEIPDAPRGRAPETEPEPVVEVSDLVIGYGRRAAAPAVDGVSLELRRGEILALVGESGSGKSTLAWSLAGLHRPTSGEMRVLAQGTRGAGDLTRPAASRPRDVRRRVQMIFQNADTSLNPRREVATALRRPVRFFGTYQGQPIDAAVEATADDVQLARELLPRLPGQLSGGQRQRVGIGRALAAKPDVLVADEITTALDVSVQAAILRLLRDLRDEHHLACLFISHDLAVVHELADSVVVLHRGRVVERGPTAVVFAGPNHPYTAELLQATLEPNPERARATVTRADAGQPRAVAGGPDATSGPPAPGEWTHAEGMVDLGSGHLVRRWRSLHEEAGASGVRQ